MKNNKDSEMERTLGLDPSSRRKWRLKLLVSLVVLALIGVLAANVFRSRNSKRTVHFESQEARKGSLTIIVTATGNLEPTQ